MTFQEWYESGHLSTLLYIRRRELVKTQPGYDPEISRHHFHQGRLAELEDLEKFKVTTAQAIEVQEQAARAVRAGEYKRK